MSDSFMELRSMILLELCCPPLPLMAVRQETGEQTVTNTHDLLSVFLMTAFRRQDDGENQRRRVRQTELNTAYQNGLESGCNTFAQTYSHMAAFMTEYLATYLLPSSGYNKRDIQILSPDYVSPHLKSEMCSYCRALRILAAMEGDPGLHQSEQDVEAIFRDCVRSAIYKKKQRVVGVHVLEGVGKDVREERYDPQTLEHCVEVL
jgi:hypothetical protein